MRSALLLAIMGSFFFAKGLSMDSRSKRPPQTQWEKKAEDHRKDREKILNGFCKKKTQIPLNSVHQKELNMANNEFALDLYKILVEKNQNFVMSPLSISMALGMVLAGAAGETEKEIKKVMKFPFSGKDLNQGFSGLMWDMVCDSESMVDIRIANALWLRKGYPFNKNYLSLLNDNYGAIGREIDFGNEPLVIDQINKYISEETNGKISNPLKKGFLKGAPTLMILTNAIYFKDRWSSKFDKRNTKNDNFYVSKDKKVIVPMMTKHERASTDYRYFEDDDLQVLALDFPFDENTSPMYSMAIFLPKKIAGLSEIERSMDIKKYQEIIEKLFPNLSRGESIDIEVFLPRFKITSDFDLVQALGLMGMKISFSSLYANFSNMVAKGPSPYLGKSLHSAFINLDENGVEAAAVTIAKAAAKKVAKKPIKLKPIIFRADHPFLFAIIEKKSRATLFLGRVAKL